jgi:hypothetical protein
MILLGNTTNIGFSHFSLIIENEKVKYKCLVFINTIIIQDIPFFIYQREREKQERHLDVK